MLIRACPAIEMQASNSIEYRQVRRFKSKIPYILCIDPGLGSCDAAVVFKPLISRRSWDYLSLGYGCLSLNIQVNIENDILFILYSIIDMFGRDL